MFLIIDNYDSFTYNLYQGVAQLTPDVKVIRNDKIDIALIKKLSPQGIIISPGPGRPESAGACIDIIRHYSGEIPLLGVCLGHQAIAAAFGANVIKANAIVHGKSSLVFHNRSVLYKNISLPFKAGRYHSLLVERKSLPDDLIIDAETPDELIMAIRHRSHPTFGMQFHPESILSEHGMKIIKNFIHFCQQEVATC